MLKKGIGTAAILGSIDGDIYETFPRPAIESCRTRISVPWRKEMAVGSEIEDC